MDYATFGLILAGFLGTFSVGSMCYMLASESHRRESMVAADAITAELQHRLSWEHQEVDRALADNSFFPSRDSIESPIIERERIAAVHVLEAQLKREHSAAERILETASPERFAAMLAEMTPQHRQYGLPN